MRMTTKPQRLYVERKETKLQLESRDRWTREDAFFVILEATIEDTDVYAVYHKT